MNIHGRRVILRAVDEGDLPQLHTWANDPDLWAMLGGWRFALNIESTKAWFRGLGSDANNHRYAIVSKDDGTLIGTANLVNIDMKNGTGFHGMMLGAETSRRRGYGRDTVMAVMRYAFDELRLERLDSDIIEYNLPSYRLYVGACGWKEEGRQRGWHFRQGRRWDRIIIGVTRDDYRELLAENDYWAAP